MRLLDSSSFQPCEFSRRNVPKYVTESHTWGEEEVTFLDIQDPGKAKMEQGFRELERCCEKARLDGF
jgi:hypothetical protein